MVLVTRYTYFINTETYVNEEHHYHCYPVVSFCKYDVQCYSAGVAYTKEIASGGLGPALRAGRANIQFKQREDLIDFIVKGSVNGKAYGVNGVGGGKMPGFGAVLPQSDIELIIDYLRGMTPDA